MQVQERKPVVGLLSYSAIADDPRVRRQGDAIRDAGWTPIGFGLAGAKSQQPNWKVVETSDRSVRANHTVQRAGKLAAMVASMASGKADPWLTSMFPGLPGFLDAARRQHCDLWIANDWPMLHLVQQLCAEQSVPYVYDTHELATDEFGQDWRWKLTRLPLVRRVEGRGIRAAARVSCVCDGIGRELVKTYALRTQPLVIRNVPEYTPPSSTQASLAPASDRIRVLYHGIIAPGRGIEETIASVPDWRPEFSLTVRGPADSAYREQLRAQITRLGMAERVVLAEPVRMTQMVNEAARFDVGYFALPGNSLHNLHVLPNKLFEYIMAGLALCVSDLPEMSAVVRSHDLGVLITSVTRSSITEAINALSPDRIATYKRNARLAAKALNWGQEKRKLIDSCQVIMLRDVAMRAAQ